MLCIIRHFSWQKLRHSLHLSRPLRCPVICVVRDSCHPPYDHMRWSCTQFSLPWNVKWLYNIIMYYTYIQFFPRFAHTHTGLYTFKNLTQTQIPFCPVHDHLRGKLLGASSQAGSAGPCHKSWYYINLHYHCSVSLNVCHVSICLDLLHALTQQQPRKCPRCHRHMPLESLLSQRCNWDQCGSIWCKMQNVAEASPRAEGECRSSAHQDPWRE